MAFQADANEIIEQQSQTIAALYKENAILKSQLMAAEREMAAVTSEQAKRGPGRPRKIIEGVPEEALS